MHFELLLLNNWRRHWVDVKEGAHNDTYLDEYSSAISFDGWTVKKFGKPSTPNYEPLPVSPPQTHLLREGWKQYGLIDPFERPATYQW